ncbi:MAG: hypothetical protein EOP35_01705 [Rubrivivax sp.]|nr:MAG: hypothetical protein EOP35_01705 [Rubrivivax sp.]
MHSTDPHTLAKRAVKAALSRCVRGLIADLDGAGRAHMAIPAMRVEGRAQVALADKLRKRAEKAGL